MEEFGLYAPTWVLILIVILLVIYIYLTWRNEELKDLGIPHAPTHLLIGNLDMMFNKPGMVHMDEELHKKYGNIYGFYEGREPTIVVCDVDIIKQILVKNFNNFINRRPLVLRGIIKYGLFDAEDNHWKHLRTLTSATFSPGRLRYMTKQINRCAAQLKENLQKTAVENMPFEAKEVAAAFTMDVISATGFGLQLDTLKDVKNPFNVNGRRFFDSMFNTLGLLVYVLPGLMVSLDKLGICSLDNAAIKFFANIIKQNLKERKESTQCIEYSDFLQLMIDAKSHLENADEEVKRELIESKLTAEDGRKQQGMTEDEILGQSLTFLLVGFDTTSTTLSFVLYELADNPEIQDRVLAEVQKYCGEKEELTYDDVNKLSYTDMCIDETLRKYPISIRLDRRACEEVTYKGVRIPKGYLVTIPIRPLHYNPEIWPDPEKFDPERFTAEAKAARNPYYYMPFGHGPRQCVGMRFALLELKIVLATAIRRFRFKLSSKFKKPAKLENTFHPKIEGGIWLDVECRQ